MIGAINRPRIPGAAAENSSLESVPSAIGVERVEACDPRRKKLFPAHIAVAVRVGGRKQSLRIK